MIKMALGRLLEGFITVLIGANLVSPVADAVGTAKASGNLTSTDQTLLGLVTLFFVLGVMVAGVQIGVAGLAEIGLI